MVLGTLADWELDEDLAYAAAQLGRFLVLSNQSEEGVPRLELALELAEALRLPEVFCQALTSKAIAYVNQNRLEEGRILLEGALERALANDLHTELRLAPSTTWRSTTSPPTVTERLFDVIAQGLELARRVGDRLSEVDFVYGPLESLVLLGEWDEVLVRAAKCGRDGVVLSRAPPSCRPRRVRPRRPGQGPGPTGHRRGLAGIGGPAGAGRHGFAEAHVLRLEGRPREALPLQPTPRSRSVW